MTITKFRILHFSDLHLGVLSSINESNSQGETQNLITSIKYYIEKILKNNDYKLAILSGDIGSLGEEITGSFLKNFIGILKTKGIPILPCPGNHDLIRSLNIINPKIGIHPYISVVQQNIEDLNCTLSKKFEENLACYKYFDDVNSVFISLNSWENAQLVEKGDQFFQLEGGHIAIDTLKSIIEDIKNEIKSADFSNLNKFLVCHHPLDFNKDPLILNTLKEEGIEVMFTGHIHKYSFSIYEGIKNFIVGSYLANSTSRKTTYQNVFPMQFNCYQFDFNTNLLKSYVHFFDTEGWRVKFRDETEIHLNHPMDLWSPILKRKKIKFVVGNQKLSRNRREAIGEWDIKSAAQLISYLSNRSKFLQILLLDPVNTLALKADDQQEELIKEWGGADLIMLGSPDANVGAAIALGKIFNKKSPERIILKNKKVNYLKSCKFYSEISKYEISLVGPSQDNHFCKYCKCFETCKGKDFHAYRCDKLKFKPYAGLKVCFDDDQFIIGQCNWPHSKEIDECFENGGVLKKIKFPFCYIGTGHLIIADNPFCKECECKDSKRHKLIIIEGIGGPATLDVTRFLCDWDREDEEKIEKKKVVFNDLKDAISNNGEYVEYIFFNKILTNLPARRNETDKREPLGVFDYHLIKKNEENQLKKNYINVQEKSK